MQPLYSIFPLLLPVQMNPNSPEVLVKKTREKNKLVKQLLEASMVQETSISSETDTDNEGFMKICSGITKSQKEPLPRTQSTQIHVYKFEKGVQCVEANGPLYWEHKSV
uniref:Uncharacterized protein n=1 Tax=Lepeophtheirus salmonis TaxID=72036 RepID=A0A0K2T3Z4_LEPSM